jgi:hypothetical protein
MQAPLNQCTSPWTNACKPLENRAAATLSAHTGQTGPHHRSDRCLRCAQDQHSHRSDRWPRPVRPVHNRAQKWLKTTWKPSKCVQQAISSSNFSPFLAMHESSQKCKTFNLELLKSTKFNIGWYTCPNEQVRYSIASYRQLTTRSPSFTTTGRS